MQNRLLSWPGQACNVISHPWSTFLFPMVSKILSLGVLVQPAVPSSLLSGLLPLLLSAAQGCRWSWKLTVSQVGGPVLGCALCSWPQFSGFSGKDDPILKLLTQVRVLWAQAPKASVHHAFCPTDYFFPGHRVLQEGQVKMDSGVLSLVDPKPKSLLSCWGIPLVYSPSLCLFIPHFFGHSVIWPSILGWPYFVPSYLPCSIGQIPGSQ